MMLRHEKDYKALRNTINEAESMFVEAMERAEKEENNGMIQYYKGAIYALNWIKRDLGYDKKL